MSDWSDRKRQNRGRWQKAGQQWFDTLEGERYVLPKYNLTRSPIHTDSHMHFIFYTSAFLSDIHVT